MRRRPLTRAASPISAVLADLVPADGYVHGPQPTSVDAGIYGFIANIYFFDIDTPLKRFVVAHDESGAPLPRDPQGRRDGDLSRRGCLDAIAGGRTSIKYFAVHGTASREPGYYFRAEAIIMLVFY